MRKARPTCEYPWQAQRDPRTDPVSTRTRSTARTTAEYANRFWRSPPAGGPCLQRFPQPLHRQVQPGPFFLGRSRLGGHAIFRPAGAAPPGRDSQPPGLESRARPIHTKSAAAASGPAAARSPILRFIPTLIRNRQDSPKRPSGPRPRSTAASFGSLSFPTTKSAMPNHRMIFSSISSRQPMKPRPAWRNGTTQHSRDSGICRTT